MMRSYLVEEISDKDDLENHTFYVSQCHVFGLCLSFLFAQVDNPAGPPKVGAVYDSPVKSGSG